MTIRHVATYAWAAYNFWNLPMDRDINPTGQWAVSGVNYRSPELFHELMLSRGKILFPGKLSWDANVTSVQIASGFDTFSDFLSKNMTIYLLPSESFLSVTMMASVARRLTRTYSECVDSDLVRNLMEIKVNAGDSAKTKGQRPSKLSTSRPGLYDVSNKTPMRLETCKYLVDAWVGNCRKVNLLVEKSLLDLGVRIEDAMLYDCPSLRYCTSVFQS